MLLELSGNVERISALAVMSLPETLFSGYSIGTSLTTAGEVQKILDQLKELQINRIDTAALWPRASPGCSETLLGEVKASGQGFKVDTRISPVNVSSSAPRGARTLTGPAIKKSLQESPGRLHTHQIHVLYLHRPDGSTQIGEQAAAMQEQYAEGRFDKVTQAITLQGINDTDHPIVRPT